jgi:tumor protein p53-inducible protein 3
MFRRLPSDARRRAIHVKAVLMKGFGGPEVLYIGDTPDPQPGDGELLVRVHATALNRADLLQRRGHYPPPPGASEVLGLEMAGEVVSTGPGCEGWSPGDRVFALLPGGGYAEYAVVPQGMAMRIPDGFTYEQAAAIPEVFLTAYLNLFWLGGLGAGQTVLVHAGASGVGTAAIQLIREAGATSLVTAGSPQKIQRCLELGAKAGWNYHDGSFLPFVREQTGGQGVDIILDFIGAPYFDDNLKSLRRDGRLIVIGTMGGTEVTRFNLGFLLANRLQVIGTALRSRPVTEKIRLTQEFWSFAGPRFEDGRLVPVIDRVFDWREVADAHRYMEENRNIGKIVLKVSD